MNTHNIHCMFSQRNKKNINFWLKKSALSGGMETLSRALVIKIKGVSKYIFSYSSVKTNVFSHH